jgi:putative ABC transport system permease protein
VPAYLSAAFPLGARQAIHLGDALEAVGFGVLATALASLSPAFDLRPGLAPDAVLRESGGSGGETMKGRMIGVFAAIGLLLIGGVGVLVALSPRLTILGGVLLALATLCLMPAGFALLARALPWATRRSRSGAIVVAISELRAITARSVALAGIAALAVYGCVAIGGTRSDLLRGIDDAIVQYHSTADVWVTADGDVFNTDPFSARGLSRKIAALPSVGSVSAYYGGLLDLGSRRLWVRARSARDRLMVEPSQIVEGDFAEAQRLLRAGGWAAISSSLARERRLRLGDSLELPTPTGQRAVRVAAITTNSGWPAGTLTLAASDFRRWWGAPEPTALEVALRSGMEPRAGALAVRAALAGHPGLTAQSAHERDLLAQAKARQGLGQLSHISTMLLIAAALAVASALSAAVWQRRMRLASLKIQGYDPGQLWRGLLVESAAMLGLGSFVGALVGVYGHALASRWLASSTGFPTPFAVGTAQVFLTLGLVTVIAMAVIAVPGVAAARVSPRLSLQE